MTLTKNDLNQLDSLFGKQENKYESKLEKLEEKFEDKLIEFKSEFFGKVDPILKEVATARDERTLMEDRLEKLEEIHPQGKHVITS